MNEPYFRSGEGLYYPTSACRGPWDPNSLSGSVVVTLLAFEIERLMPGEDYMPGRLTVDMYRLPDFSPVEVRTRLVRDGYRIKVVDAEFLSDGKSTARATCQMLRKTSNSKIKAWSPEPWQVPFPEEIAAPEDGWMGGSKLRRPISGDMGRYGRKRMWISEQRNLVDSIALTPWLRAAMVADLTNPWANSGEGGVGYINSDATLYLHRLPCDEWIGMEVVNHHATDGVAVGECCLYDRQGAVGTSVVVALAQTRKPEQ
jgi:hypothetical protein